jgi:undecaprenyl-diphosphatase
MSHLTYAESIVVGLIQGVTELFPLSSLGHNVLIPALVGGSWAQDLNVSKPESPYLAFIVGMHVATAIAMIGYFWRDWLRILGGFFTSIGRRQIESAEQKLAWMIIIATIPVGIAGLALEHMFRTTFAKPTLTAFFLAVNGVILFGGERLRRREVAADRPAAGGDGAYDPDPAWAGGRPGQPVAYADPHRADPYGGHPYRGDPYQGEQYQGEQYRNDPYRDEQYREQYRGEQYRDEPYRGGQYRGDRYQGDPSGADPRGPGAGRHSSGQRAIRQQEVSDAIAADARLASMGFVQALILGTIQVLALLPGISRDGVVMVGGMFRGMSRQDAARFSFLLSAPVILAAGVLKIPDLMGPLGNGIRGQVLVGSILSGVGAFLAIRFLMRYLQDHTKTLMPFAIYCFVAGVGSLIYLNVH